MSERYTGRKRSFGERFFLTVFLGLPNLPVAVTKAVWSLRDDAVMNMTPGDRSQENWVRVLLKATAIYATFGETSPWPTGALQNKPESDD